MERTLTRHGDTFTIELDDATLRRANIDPAQPVTITVEDGARIVIKAAAAESDETREAFRVALEAVNARHAATLRRLADS